MGGGLNFADELQKRINNRQGLNSTSNGGVVKPVNGPKPAVVSNPPKPQVQQQSSNSRSFYFPYRAWLLIERPIMIELPVLPSKIPCMHVRSHAPFNRL